MRRLITLVGVLATVAVVAPWLAPYAPTQRFPDHLHAPPMRLGVDASGVYARPVRVADRLEQRFEDIAAARAPLPWRAGPTDPPVFLLGADGWGRDVLSRTLHATRLSLGLGLAATFATLLLGALAGSWTGLSSGRLAATLMRVGDALLVLPITYVVVAFRAALPDVVSTGTIFLSMVGVFALATWPWVARAVRAVVAATRGEDYVLAARAGGASSWQLLRWHLLPACTDVLAAQVTLLLPTFVLAEATLSYLGLGFSDETPSWGTMIQESANANDLARFPWTLTPAVAVFAVVLLTNLLRRREGLAPVTASGPDALPVPSRASR